MGVGAFRVSHFPNADNLKNLPLFHSLMLAGMRLSCILPLLHYIHRWEMAKKLENGYKRCEHSTVSTVWYSSATQSLRDTGRKAIGSELWNLNYTDKNI